jgi:hypothetical protein
MANRFPRAGIVPGVQNQNYGGYTMRKSAKEILETIAGAGVTAEIILKGSPDEITLEASMQSLVWMLLDELENSLGVKEVTQ